MENKFENMVENFISGRKLCFIYVIFDNCSFYI